MNKSDVTEQLAIRCGVSYSEAERMLNTFINIVYQELKNEGVVNISGFGKFKVSHREARIGVNPRNPSQRITIPKLNTPKFVSGEAFKKAIAIKK